MVETRGGAKRKRNPPPEKKKGDKAKTVKKVKFVMSASPPSSMAPEHLTATTTTTKAATERDTTERDTATTMESTERINVLVDAAVGVEGHQSAEVGEDDNEKSSEATLSNEDNEGKETGSVEKDGEASSEKEKVDGEGEGDEEEVEEEGEGESEEEEGELEEDVREKDVANNVEESRAVERDSNVAEEGEGSGEKRNSAGSEHGEEIEAIKPLGMFFAPSEYKKKLKLGTRCMIEDALKTLGNLKPKLSNVEMSWFTEHPQFKHIFHMRREKNHKNQGMWMLLVRTAGSNKRREVWFIVNGVPIRYGLREHALISGLNCCNYPLDYKERGGTKFVNRYFKDDEPIRLEDVKEKLVNMGPHRDRLRMAVLFFLGSVVCAQTKVGVGAKNVLEFFQRAVDDLDFCKTFPWGRYSYFYMLKEISHTMEHFGGVAKENTLWPLPGFCVPLEVSKRRKRWLGSE